MSHKAREGRRIFYYFPESSKAQVSVRSLDQVDRLSSLHKQCKNVYKKGLSSSREQQNSSLSSPQFSVTFSVLSYILSTQFLVSATISELGKRLLI
jgi:hypothetical protein